MSRSKTSSESDKKRRPIFKDLDSKMLRSAKVELDDLHFRGFIENLPVLFYVVDPTPPYSPLYVSPAFKRFGYPIEMWTSDPDVWLHVMHPEDREWVFNQTNASTRSGEEVDYEWRIVDASGLVHWVRDRGCLIRNEAGEVICREGVMLDITQRKNAVDALERSETSFRQLGEGIFHQVWTAEPSGKLDYVNRRTLDYFMRSMDDMIGDNWQGVIHPDDLDECLRRWAYSIRTGEFYETEFRLRRHDGVYRWFRACANAGHDSKGNIIKWYGTNTDIDDQRESEARLNYYAKHDSLTDLPNRIEFMSHLRAAIDRAANHPSMRFAVLFLDLDRFKVINDSLGHVVGDKLLKSIAERLKNQVRPGDVVARLGGDEFTILLNRTGAVEDVEHVADRLQEALSSPFEIEGNDVVTSASIGIIVSDDIMRQPEDFLRDADAAMYRAKESGKARYEIFSDEMHVRNVGILKLENDLRRAVEAKEFEAYYQPIVRFDTTEITEFEALIRWHHPERGLVTPKDFIGMAEETGLIIPIGNWVIEEACKQLAAWQMRCEAILSISVNLSAKQLLHPSLPRTIEKVTNENRLRPGQLRLEVTESTVMENRERSLSVFNELISQGVLFSSDDFGTGYSSLSYLQTFPFERLKIDRSFVENIEDNDRSKAIVRSIIAFGENLKIGIVAEGIETEGQLEILRSFGCNYGQGYYFSRPAKATEIETYLPEGPLLDGNTVASIDSLMPTIELPLVQ